MAAYRARQIAAITDAVAAARLALRRRETVTLLDYAEIYVREGGMQVPGERDAPAAAAAGTELLAALREQRPPRDSLAQRELARLELELRWLELARDERLVGVRLQVPEALREEPELKPLMKGDQGLGGGIFRKYAIVVLPPLALGAVSLQPVYEDELEC